jgi:hypothetical protein
MPPFKSFQHAPWLLVTRRAGLGVGGLLLIAVLSFGVVLAGATVLSVLRGGPLTRAGPADRQGPRAPEARAGSRPPAGGGAEGAAAVSPAARARAELPGRLDEILRVREAAFARRDAGLLATVYTADCACLRSGRLAIARLRADHAVWRGRSISVRVEELSRVGGALWIALAVLRRSAFRIEGEDGTLISVEPAARQRYRFALVRSRAGRWLLGHASLVEELPP